MISENSQIIIASQCGQCSGSGIIEGGSTTNPQGQRTTYTRECQTCCTAIRQAGLKITPGYLPAVKVKLADILPFITQSVIAELDQREQSQLDSVNAAGAIV